MHQLSSWACSNFIALVLPIPLCFYARLWGGWFGFGFFNGQTWRGRKFYNFFTARRNTHVLQHEESSRYTKGKENTFLQSLRVKTELKATWKWASRFATYLQKKEVNRGTWLKISTLHLQFVEFWERITWKTLPPIGFASCEQQATELHGWTWDPVSSSTSIA